ncbi:MAG: hypothetical protein QXF55_02745 [Candidatus Aenigmatarchaeota archaeon]
MDIESVLLALRNLGFYDFLLPWLFTFAVVYGLLANLKLFGDNTKKIATALALVLAFFVTGYSGPALAAFFISIFGGASMLIAGILVIVIFLAMVGFETKDIKKTGTLVILVVVGVMLWLLSVGAARGIGFLPLLSPDIIALILVMVVIVVAVWAIVREPKKSEGGGGGKSA